MVHLVIPTVTRMRNGSVLMRPMHGDIGWLINQPRISTFMSQRHSLQRHERHDHRGRLEEQNEKQNANSGFFLSVSISLIILSNINVFLRSQDWTSFEDSTKMIKGQKLLRRRTPNRDRAQPFELINVSNEETCSLGADFYGFDSNYGLASMYKPDPIVSPIRTNSKRQGWISRLLHFLRRGWKK